VTDVAERKAGVLIAGGGLAGAACAETLRAEGYDGSILLVGREADPPYQRPPITKEYMRGEAGREEALLHPADWWEGHGVELLTRTSVMKLDPRERTAALSNRDTVRWERALVACGANVRRLRVDGGGLAGIHYVRVLGNADAIRAEAEEAEHVVLVGGSYIACEVAASLTVLGKSCTLVMPEPLPLSLAFGETAGRFFAQLLGSHGVTLVTGDGLARFEGSERVERVVCESGRELEADVVVMGTGAQPDVALARAAGLELGETGGVRCARDLRSSADGVWAAGDLCEYDSVIHGRRLRIEHYEVAEAQGHFAARSMLGREDAFAEVPYFWSDLADWCTLEYVGPASEWDAEIVRGSPGDGSFTLWHLSGGRLAAALTVGRSDDLEPARRWLAEGTDLGGREAELADPGTDLAGIARA
jgi:3-phenylpropionate/trans-cinnamate dioxygenase ferredoxin reductase component